MLKYRVAGMLDGSGATEALLRLRPWSHTPWLRVVTYHRIHPDAGAQPFDPGVIDAAPGELDRQLTTLRRYFTPIGIADLLGYVRHGRPLPERPAIVTFDDGYRECREHALPLLLAHGIPATFFVSTSYVNDRRLFWWDRVALTVGSSERKRIELDYPMPFEVDLARRDLAIRRLLHVIKTYDALDVERFLDRLSVAAGVEWNTAIERQHADKLVMTWDDVRALDAAGMEIHSHTRTHRVLQTLRPEELEAELSGSRADLAEQLGHPVAALSYPVGRSIVRDPRIRDAVKAAGYELGLANGMGVPWLDSRFDPFDVARIEIDRGMPQSYFRALLVHPTMASALA